MAWNITELNNISISISSADLTLDFDYNPLDLQDSSGKRYAADLWSYSYFFYEKIQHTYDSESLIYVDGIRLDKYIDLFIAEKRISDEKANIFLFLRDSEFCKLQKEMSDKYGIHINLFALYGLAMYVKEIIERRLVLKFKPTMQDILSEIGDFSNLEKIAFFFKGGKKIESSLSPLLESVFENLKSNSDTTYYLDSIERKVDVYTKEYGQIEFARYISRFFNEFFKIKRRKNGYVTVTEQKIICHLIKFIGYSPELITLSRYRQLMTNSYNAIDHFFNLGPLFQYWGIQFPNINFYLEFLPYQDWKNGRINPLSSPNKADLFKETISFNLGNCKGIDKLCDVINGIIGKSSLQNC